MPVMLVSVEDCMPILRCPRTKAKLRKTQNNTLAAETTKKGTLIEYQIIDGIPILIDFSDSVFSEEEILKSSAKSPIVHHEYRGVKKLIKNLMSPRKVSTTENVSRITADLEKRNGPVRLLIIGGGTLGQGMEPLYQHSQFEIYSFDVYASPLVQFVADAHHLPLPDAYFDAVVIQAVLEHVIQPSEVVAEIWRVLRPDGLVYAETPFMQQVHEGAFDFTRFSAIGHRYLFRRFELISSGASGGPGVVFMWAADFLARGIFRSVKAGKIAKLGFFWTQYLDKFIPSNYAEDGASGVFFYGRKSQKTVTPRDIIKNYHGAQ